MHPKFKNKKNGQASKSDIPLNIAPKVVTPENYLQIWDSSATLIGQLAIVTLFGAILGGIPLSGPYPKKIKSLYKFYYDFCPAPSHNSSQDYYTLAEKYVHTL